MELVFFVALAFIVGTVICCTFVDDFDSWREGRQQRKELHGYRDELDALVRQRALKREAVRQLRATARQAQRDRDEWSA